MSSQTHALVVETFTSMLASLGDWLAKARVEGGADDAIADTTLAPGMYGLAQQVRVACDHALTSASRLADEPPPVVEDRGGDGIDDLRAHLVEVIAALHALPERTFRGAETRTITMALDDGLTMTMTGERFARDWALPLFYFHVVLAYGMLRHAGVDIGTRDYLQHIGDAITPAPRQARRRAR